ETRIGRDELVIRRIDKYLHVHRFPFGLELVADNRPHRDAPIVDGRTDIQGAQVWRFQREARSWTITGNFGRFLESLEIVDRIFIVAAILPFHVHANIGARYQRTEARHATETEAWPHHPK